METPQEIAEFGANLRRLLVALQSPGVVVENHVQKTYQGTRDVRMLAKNVRRIGYSVYNDGSAAVNIRTSDEPADVLRSYILNPGEFYEVPAGDPHPYTGHIRMYWAGTPAAGDTVYVTERILEATR